MDLGLDGRTALVGGASKGIGKAIATEFVREGASVMICSRNEENLTAAAAEIQSETGKDVEHAVCDMASHDDIKRTVAEAAQKLGRLDIVVNNAGGPPTGAFQDLDERYWQHAIDQNLLSAVRTIREALPHLLRSGSGRIINVTSVSVKQPIDGLILSNATRLAVVGLAKTSGDARFACIPFGHQHQLARNAKALQEQRHFACYVEQRDCDQSAWLRAHIFAARFEQYLGHRTLRDIAEHAADNAAMV